MAATKSTKTKRAGGATAKKAPGPPTVNGVRFGTFTNPAAAAKTNMASMLGPVLVTEKGGSRWVMENDGKVLLMVLVPESSDLDPRVLAPKDKIKIRAGGDEAKALLAVTAAARGSLNGETLLMSVTGALVKAVADSAMRAHAAEVKRDVDAAKKDAKKGAKTAAAKHAAEAVHSPVVQLDGRWFDLTLLAEAVATVDGGSTIELRSLTGRASPLVVRGWRHTDKGPGETGRALVMPINYTDGPPGDTLVTELREDARPVSWTLRKAAADETAKKAAWDEKAKATHERNRLAEEAAKTAAKPAKTKGKPKLDERAQVQPVFNVAGPRGVALVNVYPGGQGKVVFEPRVGFEVRPELLELGYQNGHAEASRLVQWLAREVSGARVVEHGRSRVAELGDAEGGVWVFVALPGDAPDAVESGTGELVASWNLPGEDDDGEVIGECDAADPVACSALWRRAMEEAGADACDGTRLFREKPADPKALAALAKLFKDNATSDDW